MDPFGAVAIRYDLVVESVDDALAFYERAFGACERGSVRGPKGRTAQAVVSVGEFTVLLRDRSLEPRRPAAVSGNGRRLKLHLRVRDCDAATCRAWESGARVLQVPHDTSRGERAATLRDPFGLMWWLTGPARGAARRVVRSL